MKLIKSLTAVLILLCLVASCKNKSERVSKADIAIIDAKAKSPVLQNNPLDELSNTNKKTEDEGEQADSSKKFQQRKGAITKPNQQENVDWDKKIIKTATLQLQVKDFSIYNSALREKIKQAGGYVAQEEQNQSEYKIENVVTIKVPVDQFDNTVALLTTGIEKLDEKKITSEDVTSEVVDTKSRLEAKKQVRLRYLDLLKQAKNMADIISVQQEVDGIQEEMESAAGRINYLSHSASFSTINLTFFQVLDVSAKEMHEPSFFKRIAEAFKTGGTWLGELITGMVSIWPLILLFVFGYAFFKRRSRSKVKPV
ncbi:MAG: DUF4349 domain-containing protein [Bacteroidota bacterium]